MIDNKEFLDLQNFIVNLKDYQDFKPASFKEAKQHNFTHSLKNAKNDSYPLCAPTKSFKHNGPAVYLYFTFLKKLCILFGVFSLMTFPSILNNFYGNGISFHEDDIEENIEFKLTSFLMKFSLANQNHVSKDDGVGYVSWMFLIWNDFFISLLFLVFLIYWAVELEHQTQVALTERGLPSYYTIIVQNLPVNYTETSIKEYFSEYGDIVQISTVKKVSNVYKNVNKIENLLDKLLKQKNSYKMYKIYVKLLDEYKDLKSIYRKLEQSKPLSAFISFDQMRNRNYVLDLTQTQDFIFEESILKIEKCNIQPANILWQNYHIDQKKHKKRSFFIWMLILLIFIGGMSLLFFMRINANVGSGLEIEINGIEATIDELIQLDDQKMTDSFCYNQGLKGFFQPTIHSFCLSFYAKYTKHLVLIFKGSAIIVALNFILTIVFSYLTDYRRYPTVTDKNVFLIISKSFTIYITNTLLMLLLQCEIGGFAPRELFQWMFRINRSHQLYKQFSRKWYLDIGAQIIMTYILSILLFPFAYLALQYTKKIWRTIKARCKKRQGAMNKAYLDPEFNFNNQYCDIVNAIFTCLTFSSGLPILYPLCCITLFLIYWCSKITLLKLSRSPHPSDHTLNQIIARVLPSSLFIHSFLSRYFFSSQQLFPFKSRVPTITMIIIMLLTAVFYKCRKDIMLALRTYRVKRTDSLIFEENKSLNKLLESENKFLYSYRMQDNIAYQNVFYAITLIDMFEKSKKVKMAGRAKSEYCIGGNLGVELETEGVFNEEQTDRRIRRAKESII